MSKIEKLSISGIRSFGCDVDCDKQSIEFETPLTLLVGANGAGKTTVIECLKYITTGEKPSNCNLQGFIHDPRIGGERQSKGDVELQFESSKHPGTCKVQRSVKSVRDKQKDKITATSLGQKYTDVDGKSITYKIEDLNVKVETELGVSRSIIKNVIYCHQEDSNWPLSDGGRNLKGKFDEIFEATRYNDASKAIADEKLAQTKRAEAAESKKKDLERIKDEADAKQAKLLKLEDNLLSSKTRQVKLNEELYEMDIRINKLEDIRSKYQKLEEKEEEKQRLVEHCNDLEAGINTLFNGTEKELKDESKRLKNQQINSETKKKEVKSEIDFEKKKITKLKKKKTQLDRQHGALEQDKQTLEKREFNCELEKGNYEKYFGGKLSKNVDQIEKHNSMLSTNLQNFHQKLEEEAVTDEEIIISRINKAVLEERLIQKQNIQEKYEVWMKQIESVKQLLSSTIAEEVKMETSTAKNALHKFQTTSKGNDCQWKNDMVSLLEDMQILDNEIYEYIKKLTEEVVGASPGKKSLKQLWLDKKKKYAELDAVKLEVQEEDNIIKWDADLSPVVMLKDIQATLEEEIRNFGLEIDDTMKETKTTEQTLSLLRRDKANVEETYAKKLAELKNDVTKSTNLLNKILMLSEGLESKKLENKKGIKQIEKTLEEIEKEIKEQNSALITCQENLKSFDDGVGRLQDLVRNLKLREKKKELLHVEVEIKSSVKKLAGNDSNEVEEEYSMLISDESAKTRERLQLDTLCSEYKRQIAENKRELNSNEYKNADENYKAVLIEENLCKLAASDLKKFQSAVDNAIIRYHEAKMKEINYTIEQIWKETYCGEDIDYIKIISEMNTETKRRQFNYRVVKVTKDVELDMKGRCSAGQKVLASLVIRLALSESFCGNCGVFALDEPTTNLDHDHKRKLAKALGRLIDNRASMHKNFQLIIITHDEKFVRLLSEKTSFADHFFRVTKEDGKSKINKHKINELMD